MKKSIAQKKNFDIYFSVKSKLNMPIATTKSYRSIITHVKHPALQGKETDVKNTLVGPDQIRVSKKQKDIYLFYKKAGSLFLCVVVKIMKKRGFIVTAYYTEKIKEGRLKWKR